MTTPATTPQLLDTFLPALRWTALRYAGDAAEADDLVQTAVVKLLEAGGAEAGNGYTFLRHRVIDGVRRAAHRAAQCQPLTDDETLGIDESADPEAILLEREAAAERQQLYVRVLQELETLTPRRRAVLEHRAKGLTFAAIARQTGRPVGHVKMDCRRASQRVARAVAEEGACGQ